MEKTEQNESKKPSEVSKDGEDALFRLLININNKFTASYGSKFEIPRSKSPKPICLLIVGGWVRDKVTALNDYPNLIIDNRDTRAERHRYNFDPGGNELLQKDHPPIQFKLVQAESEASRRAYFEIGVCNESSFKEIQIYL